MTPGHLHFAFDKATDEVAFLAFREDDLPHLIMSSHRETAYPYDRRPKSQFYSDTVALFLRQGTAAAAFRRPSGPFGMR
jgi:hypothetical protein